MCFSSQPAGLVDTVCKARDDIFEDHTH